MNTKYFNWHTCMLVIIWFVAVYISNKVLSSSMDMQFVSIFYGALSSAVAAILVAVGLFGEIKNRRFWWVVNFSWLFSMNVFMWLVPFVPDLLPTWAWCGVAAVNVASITTIHNLELFVNRLSKHNLLETN